MSVLPDVAVFDFDRTLTDRDSLLPFLFYMEGRSRAVGYLASMSLEAMKFIVGWSSRQGLKEKMLARFLGGRSMAEIEAIGRRYAEEQVDFFLRPQAIRRLAWHLSQGHRCLLVSASPSFYLKPWAERYGFEEVLCSHLEVDARGCVTGRLVGLNCWGPEKKRRLLAYLGPRKGYRLYAYGDSRGDREMFELADYSFYRIFH